jgi:hypothetical protein
MALKIVPYIPPFRRSKKYLRFPYVFYMLNPNNKMVKIETP